MDALTEFFAPETIDEAVAILGRKGSAASSRLMRLA